MKLLPYFFRTKKFCLHHCNMTSYYDKLYIFKRSITIDYIRFLLYTMKDSITFILYVTLVRLFYLHKARFCVIEAAT
jgi:hypothetical protein